MSVCCCCCRVCLKDVEGDLVTNPHDKEVRFQAESPQYNRSHTGHRHGRLTRAEKDFLYRQRPDLNPSFAAATAAATAEGALEAGTGGTGGPVRELSDPQQDPLIPRASRENS